MPQSVLNEKEVFLTRFIDAQKDPTHDISHMKALVFVRPTEENIKHIVSLVANGEFVEVYLCRIMFSFSLFR